MAENWIQQGDVPRVMVPVDVFPRLVLGVPAARAYAALARRADNATGHVDSTIEQIAAEADMSRRQAAEGVARLMTGGYLEQLQQGRSGRSSKYKIFASPQRAEIRTLEHAENRTLDDSGCGKPHAGACGNPPPSVRKSAPPLVPSLLSSTTSRADAVEPSAPRAKASDGYTAEFEAFWLAYPKRDGQRVGKKNAGREYGKARKTATAEQLMAAVAKYAATCNGYPKDAERFLRDEIWADLTPSPPTGDLTDDEVNELLGRDNTPLPAAPPHLTPGSPEWEAFRVDALVARRAERRIKAAALRQHDQTTRSIA